MAARLGGNAATTPTLPRPGSGSADDIRRVIRESIDPDSWRENGGSAGSISSPGGPRFANVLVVTQTRENHERIARLLDRLHAQARPHAEAEGSAQSPARDADGAQNGAPRE